MPIQAMNFSDIKPLPFPDYIGDFMQGMQGGMNLKATPDKLKGEQKQLDLGNQLKQNQVNYAPQMSQAELQGSLLQNALSQNTLNYAPQMSQAGLEQAQGQAKMTNAKAQLPFGGAAMSGVAGDMLGLETVKKMYGEDSDEFHTAKQMFQLKQQNMQSRINYQNSLSDSMPLRYLTPMGKGIVEEANVGQGNSPTGRGWSQQINPAQQMSFDPRMGWSQQTNQPQLSPFPQQQQNFQQGFAPQQGGQMPQQMAQQNPQQMPMQMAQQSQMPMQQPGAGVPQNPIAPGSPQDLANQYALKRLKDSTDSSAREKNLYANNMEITMKKINVDDLTRFSGLWGGLKLKQEQANDAQGKPTSPEFKKLTVAVTAADLLAHQVRQFYKDSIQPSMIEKLENMTNPSSWINSPQTAKRNYLQIQDILNQEMKTYRDAMKSPAVYSGNNAESNAAPDQQNQQNNFINQKVIGGKTYFQDSNGKWHTS